jgi:hypothetical protein
VSARRSAPGQASMQIGLTMAGMQVPPLPFLGMVIQRDGPATLRTTPLRSGYLLNPNVYPIGQIQSDFSNAPRTRRPQSAAYNSASFTSELVSPRGRRVTPSASLHFGVGRVR